MPTVSVARKRSTEQQYSYAEAAKLLGVSYSTVRALVNEGLRTGGKAGIFPIYKLSHKLVRIPASAINRYLESRRVGGGDGYGTHQPQALP